MEELDNIVKSACRADDVDRGKDGFVLVTGGRTLPSGRPAQQAGHGMVTMVN